MENSSGGFWNGSPKTMFYMGLFLGLAISSTLALGFMLSLVWGGKSFGTAAIAGNTAPSPSPSPSALPDLPPAQPVKDVDEKVDHILGPKNAKVTLIEYSDFQCPFCQRHVPTLKRLLQDFPKDVRIVYRHYPLRGIHPQAAKSAEASECADKLGGNDAFWKMHDKLFEISPNLDDASLVNAAKQIGLNEGKFKSCLDSGEMAARVQADENSGNDAGVQGTPATFVNGSLVSGAVPYEELKSRVQTAGAQS